MLMVCHLCRHNSVAIDQHAADERIKLEQLQKHFLGHGKQCRFDQVTVEPPYELQGET